MKRSVFCLVVLGLLLAGGRPAAAAVPEISATPAATLLLPYFQVDLDSPDGLTTLFSINNAVASAQLAHVTVWSTWSVPVLNFDVYLTGFDVQTFDLRAILANGLLPQTGSGISPQGDYSLANASFPNCNPTASPSNPPVYPSPALNTTVRAHLKALLTGKPSSLDNSCAGRDYGDNIARGYITVDDVSSCSVLFPSTPDYFVSGGLGVASNDNVLWGDYTYVNLAANFVQTETLVHIQADATLFNTPGEYTFYGRYIGGSAADNREPLPTSFATRFADGDLFTGGTRLIVWRDAKTRPGVSCTFGPNFGSLDAEQVVELDEDENVGSDCRLCDVFPDETQEIDVATTILNAFNFGWLYLNLNHAGPFDASLGPGYVGVAQGWVVTTMSADGRFSAGFDAIQLDNANTVTNPGGINPP